METSSRRYPVPPNLRNTSVAYGMHLTEWLAVGGTAIFAFVMLGNLGIWQGAGWLIVPLMIVALCHRTVTDGIPTNVLQFLIRVGRWRLWAITTYRLEERTKHETNEKNA